MTNNISKILFNYLHSTRLHSKLAGYVIFISFSLSFVKYEFAFSKKKQKHKKSYKKNKNNRIKIYH